MKLMRTLIVYLLAQATFILSISFGEKPVQDYIIPLTQNLWSGVSPTPADQPGLRWEFAKATSIRITDIVHDWTPYNALILTIAPSKPSSSKLTIVVASEDKASEGMDYFTFSFILDFQDERTLEIPFDEMSKARNPVGWHKIDFLLFGSTWDPKVKPDPEVTVNLKEIRLRAGGKVKGPRMTDEQFFAALDLDRPGLEKVKAAVLKKDLAAARHALAAHIRTRTSPRWFVDPHQRPTLGLPVVTARSEKGKGGRFVAKIALDTEGWKHVVLPKSAFQSQARPQGWDAISGLRFQIIGKGVEREPHLMVYFDDVKLIGPNASRPISDFEHEPCVWKGLVLSDEQARQGKRSGKWWFINITGPAQCEAVPCDWSSFDALEFWLYIPQPYKAHLAVLVESYPPDTTYADMVLAHKFYMPAFKEHVYDFGPRIDWACNAMSEGESRTIEWNAQLNRHFHFNSLMKAYWQTGDERYAKELADQMVAWVEDCPVLLQRSGNSPYHHAWETLNTAVRLEYAWPDALYHCLLSPSFTDDVIITIMKSMAEQARHLVRWPTGGNWFTAESTAIYTVGTIFPEYKEAAQWRRLGIERLYKQLIDEVYPDGMEYEVALGYNLWVLSEYIRVLEIARLNDALDEIPADYLAHIEKMYNYLMYDCMPSGEAVGLNDSGNSNVRDRLIEGYRYFPHRKDFPYVASNGLQGQPPELLSCAFPYTGHYIMRSGWDKDARMLHLDAGLFGMAHQHEDKLHFIVYGYGKQLLLDAGNYMYDASRWRRYVLSTRGHNTILVDGQDQNRRGQKETHVWPKPWDAPSPPTDTRFVTTSGFDYAIGYYKDGYGPNIDKSVTHTRQIFFAKPDYWIVIDTLTSTDEKRHTCDSLFHINASEASVDTPSKAVSTFEKEQANLLIVPLPDEKLKVSVVKGVTEEPVQGWAGTGGPWRAVPTAIFSKEWTKSTQLVYIILPLPSGVSVTQPKITRQEGNCLLIEREGHAKEYFFAQSLQTASDVEVGFVCPQVGDEFRLCMAYGKKIESGECGIALTKPGSVSIDGMAGGLYLLNFEGESADVCEVRLPERTEGAQVYLLGKDLDRKTKIEGRSIPGGLRFRVEPHAFYEINFGSQQSWKEAKQARMEAAKKQKVGIDFPLRPQQPLPPAKGVKVVIQAEDFSAQDGGAVTVTDKKVNAQGKAFFHWDFPGHWLEWKFTVPQDGAYHIALRLCTEALAPQRALVIDGAFPNEPSQCLDLPCTGGYSNERDDWQTVILCDPKSKTPLPFYLHAGEHTLRLVNLQDSMNLDTITIFSPDQKP